MSIAGIERMQYIDLPLEIISRAKELSIENQNLLLMMAKAMRYTRECIARQNTPAQSQKLPT